MLLCPDRLRRRHACCGSRASTMHDACQAWRLVLPGQRFRGSSDRGSSAARSIALRSRGRADGRHDRVPTAKQASAAVSCVLEAVGPARLRCVRESKLERPDVFDWPDVRIRNIIVRTRSATSESAERWLASLPVQRSAGRRSAARHRARTARRAHGAPHARRARGACSSSTRMQAASCAHLTAQYIEHASRSSKIENQLWSALFDLTQAFLLAYPAFAREIADPRAAQQVAAVLPELIARQIVHLGLDAKLRLYRYEQWIPREMGGAARAVLARLLAADRARAAAARHRWAPRRRSSTNT